MRRLTTLFVMTTGCAFVWTAPAPAQGRGNPDWTTAANDAQRSAWVRSDPKISRESMQKPGFQFLWKIQFENQAQQLNGLTPAVLLDRYIGHRGFRSLAFLAGSSNNVYAVDTDLGRIEWQNHYSSGPTKDPGSLTCPGGITTGLSRPTATELPAAMAGRAGGGRGGPAKSGVGDFGQGAVQLAGVTLAAAPPVDPGRGRAGRGGGADAVPPARGAARGALPVTRMPAVAYILTGDGMLQSIYISNGADSDAPAKFLPANANAQGLIVADNTAYATTTNQCGGTPDGVWAMDLASKEVTAWKSGEGSPVGLDPAFSPDGTLYVTTSSGKEGSLVALEPKTLKQKDAYSAASAFTSSPVIFEHRGKILVAAATGDARVHLLDSATLGGAAHRAALAEAKIADPAFGLASWQEAGGTRWILASTATKVVALKVVDQNGSPTLQPAWISREIVSPLAPMIINGVVFVASSGEFRTNNNSMSAAQRAQRSSHAVLYALDGVTGNPVWNSGNTIGSFIHGGGLSGGSSQLYLGTHDGTLYAFGFPIEH